MDTVVSDAPVETTRRRLKTADHIGRRVLRLLKYHWPLLLAYVPLAIALRAWLLPGLIAGEDWHVPSFMSFSQLDHESFWPSSLDSTYGFGADLQAWLPSFPVWAVVGFLHRLGVNWSLLERLFWLWPLLVFLPLSPYIFLLRRGLAPGPAAVGALVFGFNTWTIGLIERGHLPALVAFTLMPLILNAMLVAIRSRRMRTGLVFAVLVAVQGVYEVRYAYLSLLVSAIVFAIHMITKPKAFAKPPVVTVVVAAYVAVIALSLYWLLPQIVDPLYLPGFFTADALKAASGELTPLHALALFYPYFYHSETIDAFVVAPVGIAFCVVPVVAALGYYFRRRSSAVLAALVVWVLFVVLASGPTSVFKPVVYAVYNHVPGFSAFRDLTKLFSILSFCVAFGVALGLNRFAAYLRLRKLHRAALLMPVVGIAAVTLVVHDAFNPLRMSNFSAATLRTDDQLVQQFIDTAPGRGRIVLFPLEPATFSGTRAHPTLSGSDLSLTSILGFDSFVPPSQQTVFSFFGSPYAAPLLRESAVQYLIVVDDPSHYSYSRAAFGISHDESVAYFDALHYLRRVKTIGRYVIYEMQNSSPLRAAFTAPCPSVFFGDASNLRALIGSQLLSSDPAIVFAAQQQQGAELNLLPNSLLGTIDTSQLDELSAAGFENPSSASAVQSRLDAWVQSTLYAGQGYQAQIALPSISSDAGRSGFIKTSWVAGSPGQWSASAIVASPRLATAAIASKLFRAPLPTKVTSYQPLLASASLSAAITGEGVESNRAFLEIQIINPFARSVIGDVVLHGARSTTGWPQNATLSAGNRNTSVTLLPNVLTMSFARDIQVANVLLHSGVNSLTLEDRSGHDGVPFAVDGGVSLTDVRFSHDRLEEGALPLVQRTSKDALIVSMSSMHGQPEVASTRLRLRGALNLPVSQAPSFTLRYLRAGTATAAYIAVGIALPGGPSEELRAPLPLNDTHVTLSMQSLLAGAYDSIWKSVIEAHSGDVEWEKTNLSSPPDWSGATVRYVDLVFLRPSFMATDGNESVLLRSFTVSLSKTNSYEGPAAAVPSRIDLSKGRVTSGGSSLNVGSLSMLPDLLRIDLIPSAPTSAERPVQFAIGDSVVLTLSNGQTVSGMVEYETPTVVEILSGGDHLGIQRHAIATINRVIATRHRPLEITIPVSTAVNTQSIRFLVKRSAALGYAVRMGVASDRDNSIRFIPATDQINLDVVSPAIPSEWIGAVPDQRLSEAQQTGQIGDSQVNALNGPQWEAITLDLPSIYQTQIPEMQRPVVKAIRVQVFANRSLTNAVGDGRLEIANLEVIGEASKLTRNQLRDDDITFDGAPRRWRTAGTDDGYDIYTTTLQHVSLGRHLVETSKAGSSSVRAIVISRGQPEGIATDSAFESLNSSEAIGTASASGLLVQLASFNRNWRAFVVPRGFTATGNVLLDWMHARSGAISENRHFRANGSLNSWWVSKENQSVLLLFVPTASAQFAAIVQLVAVFLLIVWARFVR